MSRVISVGNTHCGEKFNAKDFHDICQLVNGGMGFLLFDEKVLIKIFSLSRSFATESKTTENL